MLTYSQIIARRAEITARIPRTYTSGRTWNCLSGKRVLSIGCGPVEGEQFREIQHHAAAVSGVDTDPLSGAAYRTLADVPEGDHDALVAEHVLEHMTHEQVLDTFSHAARVLPSGGIVLITLPNVSNFGAWFSNFDHKNFSPPEDTAAMLELHGFHVDELFGWSKPSRFQRHLAMSEVERVLCRFMEENWGMTLPQFITIRATRV